MKNLLEFIPFLDQYPDWVRVFLATLILQIAAFVVALLLVERVGLGITITDALLTVDSEDGGRAIDIRVINKNNHNAQLNHVKLEFYGDKKPSGGLFSAIKESATYRIYDDKDGNGVVTRNVRESREYDITIVQPYSGNSYAYTIVPVAQKVSARGGDRFVIEVYANALRWSEYENVAVSIQYDGSQRTKGKTIAMGYNG